MYTLTGILFLIITVFVNKSSMDIFAKALLIAVTLVAGIILLIVGLLPLFSLLN